MGKNKDILVSDDKATLSSLKSSMAEVLCFFMSIFVYFFTKKYYSDNTLIVALQNWTTIYIPMAVMWIVLFMKKRGILTHVCINRLFVYIGDLSAYSFLIHFTIIIFFNHLVWKYGLDNDSLVKMIIIIFEFLLTMIFAVLYKKIVSKNKKYREYKKEIRN